MNWKYIAIKDIRNGKIYLDYADSMIRDFEVRLCGYDSKLKALQDYPDIRDLTLD